MLKPRDLCQSAGTKTFLDAMHGGKLHLARFVLDALDRKIINSRTEQGRTPLMFAISLPDSEMRLKFIRLLLENGAEVNGQDEEGRTALSQACELGHLEAVKLLVQFNADPEITDHGGNTPLMYAASYDHSRVLEFLLKSFKRLGLRVDRTNQSGQSALQVAANLGHSDCVQVLSGKQRGVRLQAEVASELPRSPGWRISTAAGEGRVWSPKPLSRHVLDRFTRQFQPHHKSDQHHSNTPPSHRETIHSKSWHLREMQCLDHIRTDSHVLAPPGEWEGHSVREGRNPQQSKGQNSWLFSRSSSCSPGNGKERGRRWTSQDPGEHHTFTRYATKKSTPDIIPARIIPTGSQKQHNGSQGKRQIVSLHGECEEWDATCASPRIVIQSLVTSKSYDTLLRADSSDEGNVRECSDSDRYSSDSWGTGSSKPMVQKKEDKEALVCNQEPSRGNRLLRSFTSPEFQGLPVCKLEPHREDSTFLLSSIQQPAEREDIILSVSRESRCPLIIPNNRRQPINL